MIQIQRTIHMVNLLICFGLPSGLTINDNGRINGRLPEGTYTFTVTATDGGGLSTSQTFTIVVGKPPAKDTKPPPPVILNKKRL